MENFIIILLVSALIASLSSENYACKGGSKDTSKSNEIKEDGLTDKQPETEEAHNSESIQRFIEWRYVSGIMRQVQNQKRNKNE